MKILCFGDSNTYGFDPRGCSGGRHEAPWPTLLAEKTGHEFFNDGRNGRTIPTREAEFDEFRQDVERYGADALIVMLGTNDLHRGAKADEAAVRMEAFLAARGGLPTLLIAPPPMKRGAWVSDDALVEESKALSRRYSALAERLGLWYADAGEWGIELLFDGVHFSQAGHERFADGLAACLADIEGFRA